MILVALLVAIATSLVASGSTARSRVAQIAATSTEAERQGKGQAAVVLPSVMAGLGLALTLRSPLGIALGIGLCVLGMRLLRRLAEHGESESGDDESALPLALDLLAACLAGGAAPMAAVGAVAAATPGPLGTRLASVAAEMSLGLAPGEAFRALGDDGPAGVAARTLRRSMEGGTPVAAAVARVAEETRHAASVRAQSRARRVGVSAVAPLMLCFLPAFVLLGVVPALYGVFVEVFSQFS